MIIPFLSLILILVQLPLEPSTSGETRGRAVTGQGVVAGEILCCSFNPVFKDRRHHQGRKPGHPILPFKEVKRKTEGLSDSHLEVEDIECRPVSH